MFLSAKKKKCNFDIYTYFTKLMWEGDTPLPHPPPLGRFAPPPPVENHWLRHCKQSCTSLGMGAVRGSSDLPPPPPKMKSSWIEIL